MDGSLPVVMAAFVTGLLGSAHCFGMCAGLSGLFAVNASVASLRSQLPMAIVYNTGRILSYAFLGVLVATVGQSVVKAIPNIAAPVRLAGGLLIVIVGLQVAFGWRFLAPLEQAGATIWKRIAPAAKSLLPVTTLRKALGPGGHHGQRIKRRPCHDCIRYWHDACHDYDRNQRIKALAVPESQANGRGLINRSHRCDHDGNANHEILGRR
jgi:hypothetical protein